jgi:hypothetical protein
MIQPNSHTTATAIVTPHPGTLVENTLFFILAAILCVRLLLAETFERLDLWFLPANTGATPATTVWLDALTLTMAAAVLARRWTQWRRAGWPLWGLALLVLAVAASVWGAADKRLALNAGFSLLITVLAGIALAQLMRAAWMPRLLLAALLATGATTAVKCVIWRTYEHRVTVEYWLEQRQNLDATPEADSPIVINFERRLLSGEAAGYQSNPNITGSFLAMWLLITIGLFAAWLGAWRQAPPGEGPAALVLCAALGIGLGVALWLTGSAGALVSAVAGLAVLLVLRTAHRWIAPRPGRATAILAAVYLLVIGAAAAYGVSRGTLPHPSMAFRWYYWSTAPKVLAEAPLTGVGRLNFGEAYLRHKPAEATEEVRDPHNLWLSLLVELGPLGLLAGGLLVIGSVWLTLRSFGAGESAAGDSAARISRGQLAAAALCVPLLHFVFTQPVANGGVAFLWAVEFAAVWVVSLAFIAWLLSLLPATPASRHWLIAGLAAALAAALIHGLIDFALLTPGGLGLFVALVVCAVRLTRPAPAPAEPSLTIAPAVVAMLVVTTHLAAVTVPAMRTEHRLLQLRLAAHLAGRALPISAAYERGDRLLTGDPLDPDAAHSAAEILLQLGGHTGLPPDDRVAALTRAARLAEVALTRAARSRTAALQARIAEELEDACLQAAQPDEAAAAIGAAARHWQQAVALYPTNPRTRIAAGRAWFHWWRESNDSAAADQAGAHLAAALAIDATRQPEEVVRLRPAELAEIRQLMQQLPAASAGQATAPAGTQP